MDTGTQRSWCQDFLNPLIISVRLVARALRGGIEERVEERTGVGHLGVCGVNVCGSCSGRSKCP